MSATPRTEADDESPRSASAARRPPRLVCKETNQPSGEPERLKKRDATTSRCKNAENPSVISPVSTSALATPGTPGSISEFPVSRISPFIVADAPKAAEPGPESRDTSHGPSQIATGEAKTLVPKQANTQNDNAVIGAN